MALIFQIYFNIYVAQIFTLIFHFLNNLFVNFKNCNYQELVFQLNLKTYFFLQNNQENKSS